MKFYEFPESYQAVKKRVGNETLTREKFYSDVEIMGLKGMNKSGDLLFNQARSERLWSEEGFPYYKLYPNLIPLLLKSKLSVPRRFLRAPFHAQSIYLPVGHGIPELMTEEGSELQSMLVCLSPGLKQGQEPGDFMIIWCHFGEEAHGAPFHFFLNLGIGNHEESDGVTLEQVLEINKKKPRFHEHDGERIKEETVPAVLKLACSVLFLATGADRIVEVDVLNKDLDKYVQARKQGDEKRITELKSRAVRRGKKGWTLGREITIPRPGSSAESEPTGRQLKYQHL